MIQISYFVVVKIKTIIWLWNRVSFIRIKKDKFIVMYDKMINKTFIKNQNL